jgi:hypothetical protein
MLFVPSNASAQAWYYHITEPPSYASYAKNLALSALEAWEDANPGLQFMSQPNRDNCLDMRGFTESCFVMTWAREPQGDRVGYAEGQEILIKGEWIRLPGWHMQVSLGETIQGQWYAFTDITVSNIARHEVGHILGLSHSNDPNSIMYPTTVTKFKSDNFRPSTSIPTPAPTPTPAPAPAPAPTPTPKPSGPVQIILDKLPPGGFKMGQAIPVAGWVKNADPSHSVTIKIIGPDKQILKITKAALSNQGTFSKAVFPNDLWSSGNYKFEVKYDSISTSKNFKFTQTSPPKTSPDPHLISPELSVEKSRFELGSREMSYAKVSGTVPGQSSNDWVFFTTTEPDGKIVKTKVKAATSNTNLPYFENPINISGKKMGKYTVSVSAGVSLKTANYIGTVTFDVVEKPKGGIGLPSTISSVKTNKSSYSGDQSILISGSIKNYDSSHYNSVTITITDSLGDTKFFKMIEPGSAGQFSVTIPASIQLEDNHYTVSTFYSPIIQDHGGFYTYGEEQKITTSFEIVGGGGDNSSNQKSHRDSESVTVIPHWVKTNGGWWASGQIDDSSFLQGIQHLIKEGILVIPPTETSKKSSSSQKIPEWIKNNAGWWAEGQIDDDSFVSGIQYLVKVGIIRVS